MRFQEEPIRSKWGLEGLGQPINLRGHNAHTEYQKVWIEDNSIRKYFVKKGNLDPPVFLINHWGLLQIILQKHHSFIPGQLIEIFHEPIGTHVTIKNGNVRLRIYFKKPQTVLYRLPAAHFAAIAQILPPGTYTLNHDNVMYLPSLFGSL